MRTRLFGSLAIAALALSATACGGDDDSAGGSAQDQVADMMIDVLNEAGDVEGASVDIDEDCLREKAGKLSDDDAKAIIDAGPDGEPEVSAEADAIGDELFECVDISFDS